MQGFFVIASKITFIAIVCIVLSILGANLTAWHLIKPIGILVNAARKIGEGNMNVRVNIKSDNEIGLLAKTFNEMVSKVKETDSLKDEFVSSVSHELKTPLAAIDGYCNLMIAEINKGYSKQHALKCLKVMKEAASRLTSFVNDILDLAKIKAGKFEVKMVPVCIDEVMREISALFEPLAIEQCKTLICDIQASLPSVRGNTDKIKQVITNILGNALKFTKNGDTITLKCMLSPLRGEKYIEVWIADTGIGIPKEDIKKVFDKFYQVKIGEYEKPKGAGLGLSIVYEIIKLHCGDIWVESEIGLGTTFKFVLPVFI